MATECWLGLLMGSDGSSMLWEGVGVPPTLEVGTLVSKTTVGVKSGRVI